jgi:hypothetical protein
VVCIGMYGDHLILAVRTRNRRGGAERLVQAIVGNQGTAGGHGTMAGGRVPLQDKDPEQVALRLGQQALQYLKVSPEMAGTSLI